MGFVIWAKFSKLDRIKRSQDNSYNLNARNSTNQPTLTAVSRVISFPIRSTSTGRHAGNSAFRWSPNVDTMRPMQEIAHSLTSWRGKRLYIDYIYDKNIKKNSFTIIRLTWSWSWFIKRDIMPLYMGWTYGLKSKPDPYTIMPLWLLEVGLNIISQSKEDIYTNLNVWPHNTDKFSTYSQGLCSDLVITLTNSWQNRGRKSLQTEI